MTEQFILHELERIEIGAGTFSSSVELAKMSRVHIIKLVAECHEKHERIQHLERLYKDLKERHDMLMESF